MRVLVGRLFHESHSFNPLPTRASDFTCLRGDDLLRSAVGSTLGGIIKALSAAGAEPVPSLSAVARPGGPVEHAAYEAFKVEIIDHARKRPIDAVAFELHGAMTTDRVDDVEGDLLAALRGALGPRPVVAVGLDLHAHVTPKMLEMADIVTACKQNPHADVVEAGERTVRLLLETAAGRLRPVTALVKLPMLLRGGLETADSPLADLHARARELMARRPALIDISICNVHSYLDVAGLGQAIVAIADNDAQAAGAAAADIAEEMWRMRDKCMDHLPSIDDALDTVLAQTTRRPWVLADRGDRVLAGAPGDSVEILRRIVVRRIPLRAVAPVTDPEAVAAARNAGPGGTIDMDVGGTLTPGLRPLHVQGRVWRLTDGNFTMRGPYQAGQPSSLGASAVVEFGSHTVLLTTLAGMTQDPEAFTSQGIDIGGHDLVVVKSGYHFKLNFAGLATALVVDTPGITNWRPGFFHYRYARPFYPEDDVAFDAPQPLIFTMMPR